MFAPGVPQVMKDFGTDNIDMASLVVSIYVLGYAFGPLIIAPLSELYGRKPMYLSSALLFLAFTLGCGWSTNMGMLAAFRFLAGTAGSCPITVGSGTIADTFKQEERGKVMGLWSFSILFGPRCAISPQGSIQPLGWVTDVFWQYWARSGLLDRRIIWLEMGLLCPRHLREWSIFPLLTGG
jgi:MFS family permease